MNNINTITLTGADERTSLDELLELTQLYHEVEIGLLYTENPEGRNRYPSMAWLQRTAQVLSGRVAIHVCGSGARRRLLNGELDALIRYAPRIQVNGRIDPAELHLLARRVGTLITQHNAFKECLMTIPVANHSLLIDASGGRGITPDGWDVLMTQKPVGRAGGLGPDNLTSELGTFAVEARNGAWVDMEGKLRTDDWFDLDTARRCAATFRLVSLAARSGCSPSSPA